MACPAGAPIQKTVTVHSSQFTVTERDCASFFSIRQTADGQRRTFEQRRASGAGKPNGWLVAPTYFRGSRPSSPRRSGPLRFAIQQIFAERGTVAFLTSARQDRSDEWRVT